uniref:Bicarbonate transporter-like transmembrane domain-containing protein n=1 Tax=Fibrocapsa japonica TaxID=94617 RepID=A0A7S2UTK4_9STRA|mmetsp:Transcript_12728/g.18773  ORF Transcript_12728/g.18773 Transcript_12728/m.18773 type:complete len:558 (+) Transcript_12728:153-1826(+)
MAAKKKFCQGMIEDLKRRAPHYFFSDWTDGCHSKVLAAIFFMFFTSIAPAITFAVLLEEETKIDGVSQLGAVEVILSTCLTGGLFALFAGQPLCIVGVTGPVTIFSITVFGMAKGLGINFMAFYGWTQIWAAIMHVVLAMTNACDLISWVTRFSCETFGVLIAVIYLYTGIKDLVMYFQDGDHRSALLQLIIGLGCAWTAINLTGARSWVIGKQRWREILADYGATVAIVLFTAVPYLGENPDAEIIKLQVPDTFEATSGRDWLVDLSDIEGWAIVAAIVPGFILTVLFFFDHNVSSLLAQTPEFGLKKGSAYHWDFFIVGISILLTGLLGIPPTNGLIPQAPLHTKSLAEVRQVKENGRTREVVTHVHEQRVSNLMQALFIGIMLADPLLKILGLIPRAALDGLFLYMGLASFPGNQFAERVSFWVTQPDLRHSHAEYLEAVPFPEISRYTLYQFCCFVVIFAVTLTPAAMVFPVLIAVLVPLRKLVYPKIFPHLDLLDGEGSAPDLPVSPRAQVVPQEDEETGNNLRASAGKKTDEEKTADVPDAETRTDAALES